MRNYSILAINLQNCDVLQVCMAKSYKNNMYDLPIGWVHMLWSHRCQDTKVRAAFKLT